MNAASHTPWQVENFQSPRRYHWRLWFSAPRMTRSSSGISWCEMPTDERPASCTSIPSRCLTLPPLSAHHSTNSITFSLKGKGSPYSITECRVQALIPVLGRQPARDASHKPGGRLPLLSTRPAVTPATLKRVATNFAACLVNRGTIGVKSLPKTVNWQRRGCNLNLGPSAPESSMLTTRLLSYPLIK